ncbi:MAG TPA: TetR/AcrR family transcriptional regulator [Solirubrobacteraceae bacterium]|jgi:AcrR family transcriptional regulator
MPKAQSTMPKASGAKPKAPGTRPIESTRQEGASARERLLAAADELFYDEGVQTVGVDRIVERAGVAKASLYSLFGSKEALVRAYLDARHQRTIARITSAIGKQTDPRAQILAVFQVQTDLFAKPGFHGCAFAAASTEAPAGGLVQQATSESRKWLRGLFCELAEAAGAPDPAQLAAELHIIYDGATLSARLDGDPATAATACRAAEALLEREL